jgi:hypothetical protein
MQELNKDKVLEQIFSTISGYSNSNPEKVVDYKSPDELKELLNLTINETGDGYEGVFKRYQ